MRSAGSDPEALLTRLSAVSLAVQALIERLIQSGKLEPSDLVQMREFGLELADQMQAVGNSHVQVSGARVEDEVRAFWEPLGVPATMGRVEQNDR